MSRAELRWAEQIAKELIERERGRGRWSIPEWQNAVLAANLEARERDDNELTEDDAFLEYADARADEIEPEGQHTHVFVNVKLCRYCGRQPHYYYRTVEGVQVEGEVL